MTPNTQGLLGDRYARVVIPLASDCCGDCAQGRRQCPCPEACELADPAEQDRRLRAVFWRIYFAVLLVAVCAGVAWMLPV
jgi:hypothetical protein